MSTESFGQQYQQDPATAYDAQRFMVLQLMNKLCTVAPVVVVSSSSAGSLAMAGRLVVHPLVMQTTGNLEAVPHGDIFDIPYVRLQGGSSAIILDPRPGDIGLALFAMRDISAVKATGGLESPPGSRRVYDWADALYLGGILNGIPLQYVRFSASGIELFSPLKVKIDAPLIELQGNVMQTGDLTSTGTILAATDVVASTVSLLTHVHISATPGSPTSPPVP